VLEVLTCIATRHDLRLVLLAALICAMSAATSMQAFHRACRVATADRLSWLVLAGAVGGAGVWTTHFVAMLAYSPGLAIQFGIAGTAGSLLIAVGGACTAFLAAASGRGRPLLGGLLLGATIVALHYSGVAAIQAVHVRWSPVYVVASLALSVAGAVSALWIAQRNGLPAQIAAPVVLVLGIVGLHFTAMTAMTVVPDLSARLSPELLSRPALAAAVGGMALLILIGAGVLILVEAQSRLSSRRTLDAAFQSAPEGTALYDPTGRLVLWNNAFRDLIVSMGAEPGFGVTEQAMVAAIAQGGRVDAASLAELASRADLPLASTEGSLPDGRILHVDRRQLDDGSVLTIVSDVTDQRRWVQAMEEARDKAEAANRAKSEFLANMSHELRTPLNGVLGMVQAVERDELSSAQRVRVEVVHESARALLGTLDDILDLAKIEAGRSALVIEAFDLGDLILSVSASFTAAAVTKALSLDVTLAPDAAGWWSGDAGKLRRVLAHLVDNSLKFTAAGGVKLNVAGDGDSLAFRVEDTGIGFDPLVSETLFDNFVQGDASTTRRFGGAGVGLSLCREWVQAMGGDITADGAPGRGACFTVRLPLERAQAPAPVAASPAIAAPASVASMEVEERAMRVLAAEDNETNQLVLRSLLQTMEVDLTVVENGRLAVDAFAAEPYDLVLMDIQMPEMNGVDAARAIRTFEREQGRAPTPIIALTANVMPGQVAEYRAAGMDDCVAKPIELERLFNAMAGALGSPPAEGLDAAA